jgi:hypothetical protein
LGVAMSALRRRSIPGGPFSFGISLPSIGGKQVVGLAEGNADESLKLYLSELRVWNNLRDPDMQTEEMCDHKPGTMLEEKTRAEQRAKVLALDATISTPEGAARCVESLPLGM